MCEGYHLKTSVVSVIKSFDKIDKIDKKRAYIATYPIYAFYMSAQFLHNNSVKLLCKNWHFFKLFIHKNVDFKGLFLI